MSWFRLDDKAAFHAKVVAAGNEAYGVWCRAGSWCSGQNDSENTRDGFIPLHMAKTLCPKPSVWKRLLDVRLTEPTDGGYLIHDYIKYNPTALEVIERRRKDAEKKAGQRARGGAAVVRGQDGQFTPRVPRLSPGDPQGDSRPGPSGCPPLPDPTRPDPSPKKKKEERESTRTKGKERPLPEGWEPDVRLSAWLDSKGVLPADRPALLERFKDTAIAKGWTYVDWNAGFRTFVANQIDWNKLTVYPGLKPAPAKVEPLQGASIAISDEEFAAVTGGLVSSAKAGHAS